MLPTLFLSFNLFPGQCTDAGSYVQVETSSSTLHLCTEADSIRSFKISIGKAGWGKQRRGDNKTPVGKYRLGAPRPSNKFHIFIPIAYPTREQKAEGYTGGAIGIHGPHRDYTWLGRLSLLTDWTQGCIAVARDGDIEAIADWVRASGASRIVITRPAR